MVTIICLYQNFRPAKVLSTNKPVSQSKQPHQNRGGILTQGYYIKSVKNRPLVTVTVNADEHLSKSFDTTDLKDGIEWVLNAPNYKDLCHNARNKVVREFDSTVVAKKYIALYEEVLHV